MNLGLCASLDAGNVISHGIHACLSRVDFDYGGQLRLAPLKLLFPVDAEGLAEFQDHGLRVSATVKHINLRVHGDFRALLVIILYRKMKVLFHI